MVSSSLYDDPAMEAFPVLVIEKSDLTEREILDNAPARHHKKIKTQAICVERLRASKKVLVYAIFPAAHQSYLSESMNHCHYQVRQSGGSRDMQALRAAVKAANETKGVEASLIEILPCQLKFDDGFLRVDNNPDLSGIDFSVIKKKLEGLPKDPERNNVCLDLGYSGQHNTKRDVRYFGLPHSNLRDHTTEPWAVDMFVGVTECIDTNYPDVCEQVYNDPERNMVFANEIDADNRGESARCAKTNGANILLAPHFDKQNCTTPGYAFVACFSCLGEDKDGPCRFAVNTYGKAINEEHMQNRRLHLPAILVLKRLYDYMPDLQKSQGTDVYPASKEEKRVDRDHTQLDKGTLYSLFSTGMLFVFLAYPILCEDVLMAAAFLANVVMSEMSDHYYQICTELVANDDALTDTPITECDAFDFGYAMSQEIFRRKREGVSYPTKQRHAPAVNRPPSREQMDSSILAIAKLINELRLVDDIDSEANALHYYGKACEYLVDEAFGAGHLTAMHIIGVAACLQLVPPELLEVAEIGVTTRTWKFFKWAFGYSDEKANEQTNVMLRATAFYLGIPVMWVEELCCQLCKYLAPHNSDYDEQPCTIDFANCVFGQPRSKAGDVVYWDMFLFRMHPVRKMMYCLDSSGKFSPAPELMADSIFKRKQYNAEAGFWNRKPKRPRNFHYKRKSTRSKRMSTVQDYFEVEKSEDDDEYRPEECTRKRKRGTSAVTSRPRRLCRDQNLYKPRNHIAFDLYGPDPVTVVQNQKALEPLDLRQDVWEVLGGQGQWNKDMFRINSHQMHLVRPPGTHPSLSLCSPDKELFYTCELVAQKNDVGVTIDPSVNLVNSIHYPNPLFDMIPTEGEKEEALTPHHLRTNVVFSNVTIIGKPDSSHSSLERFERSRGYGKGDGHFSPQDVSFDSMPNDDDTTDDDFFPVDSGDSANPESDSEFEDDLEDSTCWEPIDQVELHDTLEDAKSAKPRAGKRRRRALRPRRISHSERTEPNWPWNCCRRLPSSTSPYGWVMAVRSKDFSVNFALLEFFFKHTHLFDLSRPQIRSLLFFDDIGPEKIYKRVAKNRLNVDFAREARIYYNPLVCGREYRNKLPFLTAIQYPKGGCAYYLCNSFGQRISQPLLKKAFPMGTRNAPGYGGGIMYEFISIVSHKSGSDRLQVYPNSAVNLMIKWKAGMVTEEPMLAIFNDCPLEVVQYAETHCLLDQPGWSRVRHTSEKHKLYDDNREFAQATAMVIPKKGKIRKRAARRRKSNK